MEHKDYYRILGVERNTSMAEIKKTYRRLARQYHPDLNPGNPYAEDYFKEITAARAVLTDPVKRAEYDQLINNRPAYSPRPDLGFDWTSWATGQAGSVRSIF